MSDHPHTHDEHPHPQPQSQAQAQARGQEHAGPAHGPETPVDPGSQALSEALRSSFTIVKFVMFALLIVFLASGFFQVGPQEQAIILRFGKPVGEGREALLGPGLHWSLPYPIDEYEKIPITEIQQVRSTIGWYATTDVQEAAGTEPPPGPSLNPLMDGYVLTADGNIIHSRATLFYRVEDPIQFRFGFTNAPAVVQNALDNALVQTAARFNVDDIITRNVAGFRDAVTLRASELLDQQKIGVVVDHVEVQSIPPRQVKVAFENVLKAEINRNNVLNVARSYENQVLSKAVADSQSLTNTAELERVQLVSEIQSLAGNFEKILPEYRKNPELFVQKSLNESISRAFTNAEKWVLPATANGKSPELRLLLNREPPKPKISTGTPQ